MIKKISFSFFIFLLIFALNTEHSQAQAYPEPTSTSFATPMPSPTPAPPTPTPMPTPFPSPSPTPAPSPTPTPSAIPSLLVGDTLPGGFVYNTLVVDGDPHVFDLHNSLPNVYRVQAVGADWAEGLRGSGYAMAFNFFVKQGQNIDILALELDIETVGSYVGNHLYDPNGNRISWSLGSTRNGITSAPADGIYSLIVQTFENKEGRIQIQVWDRNKEKIESSFAPHPPVNNYPTDVFFNPFDRNFPPIGRWYFDLKLKFPSAVTISNSNTLEYFSKDAGGIVKPQLWVIKDTQPRDFYSYLLASNPSLEITNLSSNIVLIKPQVTIYFDKGYYYTLLLGKSYENSFGTFYHTSFHAVSTSNKTADLNNDSEVDIRDYAILSAEFEQNKAQYDADLNLDNMVDIRDYAILSAQFEL